MADEPRTYANKACPYCSVELDPLPKAKRRCDGCGQAIYVRVGPDGLIYQLRVDDLPVFEQVWTEYREAELAQAAVGLGTASAPAIVGALAEYVAAGVRTVERLAAADACPTCRALRGEMFGPESAPPIPVPGCERDVCRCDYLPVI
jgi:hypothetical protein